MRLLRRGALLACAALSLVCVMALLAVRSGRDGAAADAAQPSQGTQATPDANALQDAQPLFASLDVQTVSDVTITTPERTFRFAQSSGDVSVNGQKADAEIFMTLLTQIVTLPIAKQDAFAAEGTPFLTLSLRSDGKPLLADFYRDDPTQAYADVVYVDVDGQTRYGITKAWRAGKLVLTCDGTRILDEDGNEVPAQ